MTSPSFGDLRSFVAVAESASFRRAADALSVSRSSLSHGIKGLETDLGVRLFHRTTRSVALTEAGQHLLDRLRPILGELEDTLEDVATLRKTPSGTVRINAAEPAIRPILRSVVPVLLQRFPEVSVDLVSDGRLVDIVREGFDAGIRLGSIVPRDMVGVKFGGEARFVAVASPDYLATHGRPEHPDDLRDHACIRTRLPSGRLYRWDFARDDRSLSIEPDGRLILDSPLLMAEAAADGLGVAYLLESVAKPFLERGALISILPEWCPAVPGLLLYYSSGRRVPAALRAMISVMQEILPP
ncbi:LysR family transcriptional regulator [Sphingomonas sp. PAMC 26605]|uniref:LysR family transcriptional regulator n=1 Tax=Sphingomonas sp. PAMC 26605 TaxID=1112214 RepID=UPI00026CAC5F|nr:LysR family transcriptional regulator [Sphingomonas sp. PAMC 26605]